MKSMHPIVSCEGRLRNFLKHHTDRDGEEPRHLSLSPGTEVFLDLCRRNQLQLAALQNGFVMFMFCALLRSFDTLTSVTWATTECLLTGGRFLLGPSHR